VFSFILLTKEKLYKNLVRIHTNMIVELKKLIEVGGINQWNGTLWSQQHNKEKSFKIGEFMFFNGFPRET
jgi:hypothetical protein